MNRLLHPRHLAYVLLSALAFATQVGAQCVAPEGYGCNNPDLKHHDQSGEFDPCHCDDDPTGDTVGGRETGQCDWCNGCGHAASCPTNCVTDGGASDGPIEGGPILSCAGQCWPNPPNGWTAPLLLAFGSENDMPPCPDAAPAIGYEGKSGLDAPAAICGACSCAPPSGSCALPATMTVGNGTCSGTSTNHHVFDPPSLWDGSCTADGAIAAGAMCDGVPCVQSLTIAPLTISEPRCSPIEPAGMTVAPVVWTTFARSCTGMSGLCMGAGEICGPPATMGFRVCVFQQGDVDCPGFSPYGEKHIFYQGVDDSRGCSPCTCGLPTGSTCAATLTVYADSLCSEPVSSVTLDATGSRCIDVDAGTALGSKAMDPAEYIAGQCHPSGGEVAGAAKTLLPATFCCLP